MPATNFDAAEFERLVMDVAMKARAHIAWDEDTLKEYDNARRALVDYVTGLVESEPNYQRIGWVEVTPDGRMPYRHVHGIENIAHKDEPNHMEPVYLRDSLVLDLCPECGAENGLMGMLCSICNAPKESDNG